MDSASGRAKLTKIQSTGDGSKRPGHLACASQVGGLSEIAVGAVVGVLAAVWNTALAYTPWNSCN